MLVLDHDRGFLVTTENDDPVLRRGFSCRDMVLRPSAQPDLGAGDRHVCATGMPARQRSVCKRQSLLVATDFSQGWDISVATGSLRVVLREDVFLSRPTRQACARDRALNGHVILEWV